MFFTFDDVKEELPELLKNWVEKSDKLWSVYDLFFKSYYNHRLDLRTYFLFLAQALEAYHRNLYGGVYKSMEEYASNREELNAAIKAIGHVQ